MMPARLLLALLLTLAALQSAPVAARELTVAVVPIMPPAEIKRRWQPVLDQVGRETGLPLRFHFYEAFPEFEKALARGNDDFVVTSSVQAWKHRKVYRPVLRGRLPLAGLLVVRQDGPLRKLADLQGRTIAIQAGHEVSSNLLILQTLREQKIGVTLEPLNTESSALRSVVRGKADAAIVNNYLFQLLPGNVAAHLRIVHRSAELPPPAISANADLAPEVVQAFRRAMLRLRETHPALLEAILMPDLMEADLDRDYAGVARLIPPEVPHGTR